MASLRLFRSCRLLHFSPARLCAVRQFHQDDVAPIGSKLEKDSEEYRVCVVLHLYKMFTICSTEFSTQVLSFALQAFLCLKISVDRSHCNDMY